MRVAIFTFSKKQAREIISAELAQAIEDAVLLGHIAEIDAVLDLVEDDGDFPEESRYGLQALRYFRAHYGRSGEGEPGNLLQRQKTTPRGSAWSAELLSMLKRSEDAAVDSLKILARGCHGHGCRPSQRSLCGTAWSELLASKSLWWPWALVVALLTTVLNVLTPVPPTIDQSVIKQGPLMVWQIVGSTLPGMIPFVLMSLAVTFVAIYSFGAAYLRRIAPDAPKMSIENFFFWLGCTVMKFIRPLPWLLLTPLLGFGFFMYMRSLPAPHRGAADGHSRAAAGFAEQLGSDRRPGFAYPRQFAAA